MDDTSQLKIETAVFMDVYSFMSKYMAGNKKKAVEYILATINMANMIFRHPSLGKSIGIYIVKIIFMTSQPSTMQTDGRWQEYLNLFCKYQASKNSPVINLKDKRWDNALLYTGIDLFDDQSTMIVGGAQTGTICHESLSCAIVEGGLHKGYNIFIEITHELGHNLGFGHDDVAVPACTNKGYIMRAISAERVEFWSQCSREVLLKQTISYKCLYDNPNSPSEYNTYNKPGYGYDISLDEQCYINKGMGGYYYKADKRPICELLPCGKLGYTSGWTSVSAGGPALEMSYCGKNSWCYNGKCVSIPPISINRFGRPTPTDGKWGPWIPYQRCINTECIIGAQPLEYWIKSCSKPFPHFGGEPCEGGDDLPIKFIAIKCRKPKKCETLLPLSSYEKKFCENKKTTHPYISGKNSINLNECQIECTLLPGVNSSRFPIRPLPNGVVCNPEKNKYCMWGSCVDIPQTLDKVYPKFGDTNELIGEGITAKGIEIVNPPTPPSFDSAYNYKNSRKTTKISKKNNKLKEIKKNHLNKIHILLGTILAGTVVAIVIGYFLYKERLKQSATSFWNRG
ncbi:unnamed protein product [Gordionus sp. m RMFG-2023]